MAREPLDTGAPPLEISSALQTQASPDCACFGLLSGCEADPSPRLAVIGERGRPAWTLRVDGIGERASLP